MNAHIKDGQYNSASRQDDSNRATSEALLGAIDLHAKSSARDLRDAQLDLAAMKNDNASINNAVDVQSADKEILTALGNKGTIGSLNKELLQRAIKAHQKSNTLDNNDLNGPASGIGSAVSAGNDKSDEASEGEVIKGNNAVMAKNVSRNLAAQLDWDNSTKTGLQFNERKDAALEPAYAAHDKDDMKMNKVVLDALSGHINLSHATLVNVLNADTAMKSTIISDRKTDFGNEVNYRRADFDDHQQNLRINQLLQAELAKVIY